MSSDTVDAAAYALQAELPFRVWRRVVTLSLRHNMEPERFLVQAIRCLDQQLRQGTIQLTPEQKDEIFREMSGAGAKEWWDSLSEEDRKRIGDRRSQRALESWKKRKEEKGATAPPG